MGYACHARAWGAWGLRGGCVGAAYLGHDGTYERCMLLVVLREMHGLNYKISRGVAATSNKACLRRGDQTRGTKHASDEGIRRGDQTRGSDEGSRLRFARRMSQSQAGAASGYG